MHDSMRLWDSCRLMASDELFSYKLRISVAVRLAPRRVSVE
jgi:hypothetical protein